MDFHSSNPWPQLRRRLGLPPAASSCPLTNSLARLRGQGPLSCSSLVEVILGSWLLEYPQQLSAHQVSWAVCGGNVEEGGREGQQASKQASKG